MFVHQNQRKRHEQNVKHKNKVERAMIRSRQGRGRESGEDERARREVARLERMAVQKMLKEDPNVAAHETVLRFNDDNYKRSNNSNNSSSYQNQQQRQSQQQQQQFSFSSSVTPYRPGSQAEEEASVAKMWQEEEEQQEDKRKREGVSFSIGLEKRAKVEGEEEEDDEEEEHDEEEEETKRMEERERMEREEEERKKEYVAKVNVQYDPSNPYGQWKEASPPKVKQEENEEEREEEEEVMDFKTRKQIKEEEDEKWEESAEEDLEEGFEIVKKVANDRVFNEAIGDYMEEANVENVSFKSRTKKQRNQRKKVKTDINE